MEKVLKILVVDDLVEIQELVTFSIQMSVNCEVTTCNSSVEAIAAVKENPAFDLIISDMQMPGGNGTELLKYLDYHKITKPVIILSGEDPLKFPDIQKKKNVAWVEKPFTEPQLIGAVQNAVGNAMSGIDLEPAEFVPVRLDLLRLIHDVHTPLFVRINAQKYVKMTQEESIFSDEQYRKYKLKGVSFLYIENFQIEKFIAEFRKKVFTTDLWKSAKPEEVPEILSLNIELMRQVASQVGWRDDVLFFATENIQKVLYIVANNRSLNKLLEKFHHIEKFGFADHCTLMALVATAIAVEIGLDKEEHLQALSYAALFHDMTLTDEQYDQKPKLIKAIQKGDKDRSKDAKDVFRHPARAAEMVRAWDFCPEIVEEIILCHHENPMGTGFPMGRKAEQISLISAAFIIAEDYTQFVMSNFGNSALDAYISSHRTQFAQPPFEKAFQGLIRSSLNYGAA